jgi:subtilisin-like proprotein convertase family protein
VIAGLAGGVASVARADTNPASIAVPLIGTQGVAAPYPSSITVAAPAGPDQRIGGNLTVWLHGVTHPCPKDLAILLVHDDTDKFLLMSNAGGCKPLRGTTMIFRTNEDLLPEDETSTVPHGSVLNLDVSNYGAIPSFPAPAPAPPYNTDSIASAVVKLTGTWKLYVMDTGPTQRGVIAGGWSLHYATDIDVTAFEMGNSVPGNTPPGGDINGPGIAFNYPMTFNANAVRADVKVVTVRVEVTMQHTWPDDLRMVLQSPTGTAVALMANAGGNASFGIPIMTKLTFADGFPPAPDGPIGFPGFGNFSPGSVYPGEAAPFGSAIPAPGPQMHATSFAAFTGETARGVWKLWVYDDGDGGFGTVDVARLTILTEGLQSMTVTPITQSTQPFIHVTGGMPGAAVALEATWRVTQGGTFYDAGRFTFTPGTNTFAGDVPVKKGANTIEWRAVNTKGQVQSATFTTTVNEFTYTFAEGSTGAFFDTDITLSNATGLAAPVTLDFLPEFGSVLHVDNSVAANAPYQLAVDTVVPSSAFSTVVHSTQAVPLAAERTMSWDTRGYGGTGAGSTAPHTRWLFAEGSQGFFSTYLLLANDNASPADVTLNFLLESGGVVTLPVTVAGKARRTIYAGDVSGLVNQSFGVDVTSSLPIIAERAMYLPGPRLFEGGHASAGVNETSRQWFLAEGATGSFFETYVLMSNPNSTDAHVTLTYLLPDGTTIPQTIVIAAHSRRTIDIETDVDPRLASADVSTTIQSDIGIVAERAMYWPDISQGWREAHNSFGVTETALHWGLADGRIGGPRGAQTYVLLANPNPYPAEVEVRFLKPTVTATRTYTLPPFTRRSIFTNFDVPELGDGVFGADVRVLNYQPIAVEKALYWNSGGEVFAGGTNVTATRLPPP